MRLVSQSLTLLPLLWCGALALAASEASPLTIDLALSEQPPVLAAQFTTTLIEIYWVDELQLPAQIIQTYPNRDIITKLDSHYPMASNPWPRRDISGYGTMDYADTGDSEAHPLVRQLNAISFGGHIHY